MPDEKKLWIVRAILAVAGLVLLAPAWKELFIAAGWPPVWSESAGGLLKGIGEAIVVALILERLVDAPAKRRLAAEAIREVAPRILAHLLPPAMFQYIDENLLRANLVRRSWNITYRISVLPDTTEYVKLETESRYEMANTAPTPATYPAVYEVERSLVKDFGETEITEVTVLNLLRPPGHTRVFHYPDADPNHNRPEDTPQVIENRIVFKKIFQIPVHQTRTAFEFIFKSTEYFHVGSIVPFFAKYPVELTTLTVDYPKDILNVVVDLPANRAPELKPDPGDPARFVFPIPILPGQGFTVRFSNVQ